MGPSARVRLDILRKEWSKLGLEVLRRAQKISVFGWLTGLVFSATNTTSELNMGVCYREHMLRLLNAFVICQDFSSNLLEKPKQPRARIFKARSILTT